MEAESTTQIVHVGADGIQPAEIPGVLVMQDTYQKSAIEPISIPSGPSPSGPGDSGPGNDGLSLVQKQMMTSAASAFAGASTFGSGPGSLEQQGSMTMQQTQSAMKVAKALTSTSSRRSVSGAKRRSVATRLSVVSGFRSSSRASANGGPQVPSPRRVSMAQRIKAAATEQVELPLVQGTSVRIFLFIAAAVMAFTIYYIISLVAMAAIEQRKDPPGQFVIEYADRLQTPVIRICPDQFGLDLTTGERYGFQPICIGPKEDMECTMKKIPDTFGEDPNTECYVFNYADGKPGYPFIFEDTYSSITIVLYTFANTSDERLIYQGVPFVLYHDDKLQGKTELPRNGYIPLNTAAMATLVLDKHIDIDGNEDWYFTSPGLTSLPLSENFVSQLSDQLNVPPSIRPNMGLVVINLRFASLQVTMTQEYLPLGPMEIIAALGGIFSLSMGIMQALYPEAERATRRFIFDVVKEEEVEESDEEEEGSPAPGPRMPSVSEEP